MEYEKYFSKNYYQSKHNLVYWNNERYYGFGLSACGYINNYRYDNTKNMNEYNKGNYIREKYTLSYNLSYLKYNENEKDYNTK